MDSLVNADIEQAFKTAVFAPIPKVLKPSEYRPDWPFFVISI